MSRKAKVELKAESVAKVIEEGKRMEKINGHAPSPQEPAAAALVPVKSKPAPERADSWIDETEALRRVRPLGLNFRALWWDAGKAGKTTTVSRRHMYSSMFIDDLAANYYTQDEAIDLLRMPASTFWEWVKVEGIGFVKIGKAWLFPKDVIVAKRRAK